jgi:hypothetical protein
VSGGKPVVADGGASGGGRSEARDRAGPRRARGLRRGLRRPCDGFEPAPESEPVVRTSLRLERYPSRDGDVRVRRERRRRMAKSSAQASLGIRLNLAMNIDKFGAIGSWLLPLADHEVTIEGTTTFDYEEDPAAVTKKGVASITKADRDIKEAYEAFVHEPEDDDWDLKVDVRPDTICLGGAHLSMEDVAALLPRHMAEAKTWENGAKQVLHCEMAAFARSMDTGAAVFAGWREEKEDAVQFTTGSGTGPFWTDRQVAEDRLKLLRDPNRPIRVRIVGSLVVDCSRATYVEGDIKYLAPFSRSPRRIEVHPVKSVTIL